jgi:hypothetical protein
MIAGEILEWTEMEEPKPKSGATRAALKDVVEMHSTRVRAAHG